MSDRKSPDAVNDDPTGPTVVVFAVELKSEFATAAHRHARGQMIGCSRGVVTVSTASALWVVPAGHGIWLPPDQLHGGQSFGPSTGWSVYIRPDMCGSLPAMPRTIAVPPLLREAVLRAATWEDTSVDEARSRIADLIVHEISTLPAEQLHLPMPREPRLQRIARALLEEPSDHRSLEAWAKWAGVTPRTLSRRFPQETGLSFTKWRQRARMTRALEMLAEGTPVTMIAIDLGYSSISGFIALFRRTFGVTPTAHPIGLSTPR